MAFSIASLNINGGRSSIRKAEVKQFVETNHIDVLLLQETRCSSSCASEWQRIMRGKWFFSSLEHPRAGVAVYIQPSFCSPSVVFNEIIKGYLISLTFTHNGFKHTVLNVYAPSDSTERLAFYTHLETSLVHIDFDGLVCLGGDFNCTMDSAIDRNGEEPHPASTAFVESLVQVFPGRCVENPQSLCPPIHVESVFKRPPITRKIGPFLYQ